MNNPAQEQQRLLIVDDSKVVRVTARKILRDHFETVEALDGEHAWEILTSEEPFSLVISDLSMPNLDGFGLLERIRRSHLPHISDLPVITITGANDSETIKERATQAGATDFIGKPFDAVHLLARANAHASAHATTRTLREETLALEAESAVDPLTRITNEMAFMECGYQQLAYAVRHNTRLSVFRIEVDNFGTLYKVHGESAVESIIQTVATVLTTTIRHEDTAARIGTARFALMLPGLNNNGIHSLANRIRKNINECVLKHDNTRIHYTISIGVAAAEISRDTRFDDLLSIANSRLVYAIAHGGDQIVHEGGDYPLPPVQPDTETATADQAVLTDEMEAQPADTPVRVEEVEADLPTMPGVPNATPCNDVPVIECRMTDTPAASPDKGMAAGSIDSKTVSPGPDQDTSAPLEVPDLTLAAETKSAFSLPGERTEAETTAFTADSNPHTPLEQETAAPDATTGATDTSTGHVSNEDTENVVNDNPPVQTVDIRTARIGILKRLLTGVRSLFMKARKPK